MFRDEMWLVSNSPEQAVPGWLSVFVRRHAEGLFSLTEAEASAFGLLISRVARAITVACEVDRVYLFSFNDHMRHVHAILVPRPKDLPLEYRLGNILSLRGTLSDSGTAATTAKVVARLISSSLVPDEEISSVPD